MTESEWVACSDDDLMLDWLVATGKASDRKLCLFACACCRAVEDYLVEEGLRAIQISELYADGLADASQVKAVRQAAKRPEMASGNAMYLRSSEPQMALRAAVLAAWGKQDSSRCIRDIVKQVHWARGSVGQWGKAHRVHRELAALLREIFGPMPFRDVHIDPAWLAWNNCTIPRLAEAAYNKRQLPGGTLDVARLAVLADALEESGCDDAGLLGHLRSEGPHWRGCWALDLLLQKG